MAEKDYTDKELEILDSFLQFEFYYEIYEELTNKDSIYFGLFEPLEFCQMMLLTVEMIEEKKTRPLSITKHLKKELTLQYGKEPLTDKQRYFFYEYVLEYFVNVRYEDEQIEICCSEISKLQKNLDVDFGEKEISKQKDAFDIVLETVESLPTFKEKIAYLIDEKTHYEQNKSGLDWTFGNEKNFGEKCDLEIKKLEKLSGLENAQKLKFIEVAKHKDLTIDRVIFLLNRLIPSFSDCEATKKAEFINFLTGFDYETTRQRFSSIHRKDAEKPQAFKKDMEIICKYLDLLGLREISSQIKRDLDFW